LNEFPEISEKDLRTILEYSGPLEEGRELEQVVEFDHFLNKLELGFYGCLVRPSGADLGYHSPLPMYEGQDPIRSIYKKMEINRNGVDDPSLWEITPTVYGDPLICPYLTGDVPCYFDGSALHGVEVFKILSNQGIEAAWNYLDKCYESQFLLK